MASSPAMGYGGAWTASRMLEKRQSRDGAFYLLSTNAQPPMTFAFLTSKGSQGVLQIVSLFDNPHSLKLRYKLGASSGGGGGGG